MTQNGSPNGLPSYPQAYPSQNLLKGPESTRTVVVGILNIFFGVVYAAVTVLFLSGSASSIAPGAYQGILLLLALAWAGFGLFIGGILLLKRSAGGVGLTKSVFFVLLAALAVLIPTSLNGIPSRYLGALLISYATVSILILYYPLIALLVMRKKREELGL